MPCWEVGSPAGLLSIFDFETKLDRAWSAGTRDRPEAAGKRLLTASRVGGHKRRTQLCGKPSRAAGLLQDVSIEDIEKLRAEIDHTSLSDLGSLSYCEVLVSSTERASSGQGPGFITKRKRSRRGKGARIEERSGQRIQVPAICLLGARDDIHARTACEVTAAEKNITRGTAARSVNLGRQSGLILQDCGNGPATHNAVCPTP